MNMLHFYLIAAAFALIGVLLIAGFVKHMRESIANDYRIEREAREHRERLNREWIERLHREAQSLEAPKPRARAYPIAARNAPPNTAQQNSTPGTNYDSSSSSSSCDSGSSSSCGGGGE